MQQQPVQAWDPEQPERAFNRTSHPRTDIRRGLGNGGKFGYDSPLPDADLAQPALAFPVRRRGIESSDALAPSEFQNLRRFLLIHQTGLIGNAIGQPQLRGTENQTTAHSFTSTCA
jgi:hypothetical protein